MYMMKAAALLQGRRFYGILRTDKVLDRLFRRLQKRVIKKSLLISFPLVFLPFCLDL